MGKKKAGAIIISKDRKSILLLYRGKEKDYTFPKGHVEVGESIEDAMKREVYEETGFSIKEIICELSPLSYVDSSNRTVTAHYWICTVSGQERIEREGDRLEWVNIDEVESKLSYSNIREYFLSVRCSLDL